MKTTLIASAVVCLVAACGTAAGTVETPSGPPFEEPTAPLNPTRAARAAVFLGSCARADSPNAVLHRMYQARSSSMNARLERGSIFCLSTESRGCRSVETCSGLRFETVPGCTPACDGAIRRQCNGDDASFDDCGRFSMTCNLNEGDPEDETDTDALCLAATPSCPPVTFVSSCREGRPALCIDGKEGRGPLCALFGAACLPTSQPGRTHCRGEGPTCGVAQPVAGTMTADGIACDGTRLRACVGGGEALVECATLGVGFTCREAQGSFFCGLGADCVPGRELATPACEGTMFSICNAGLLQKIDCTSLGFTRCEGICAGP